METMLVTVKRKTPESKKEAPAKAAREVGQCHRRAALTITSIM